jgi:hypothetical protein
MHDNNNSAALSSTVSDSGMVERDAVERAEAMIDARIRSGEGFFVNRPTRAIVEDILNAAALPQPSGMVE